MVTRNQNRQYNDQSTMTNNDVQNSTQNPEQTIQSPKHNDKQ